MIARQVMTAISVVLLASRGYGVMVSEGVREFSVGGSVDRTRGFNVSLDVKGGRFIRDFVQVGALGSLVFIEGGDVFQIGGGVFGEKHVPLHDRPLLFPYYGATCAALFSNIDEVLGGKSEMAAEVSGYGGFKYFLLDNLAIGSDLQIKLATAKIYFGDNKLQNWDWVINLSTRFYF